MLQREHLVYRGPSVWQQSIPSKNCGAPGRVRTRDPLITNQVLYQLSYKGNARQLADFAAL